MNAQRGQVVEIMKDHETSVGVNTKTQVPIAELLQQYSIPQELVTYFSTALQNVMTGFYENRDQMGTEVVETPPTTENSLTQLMGLIRENVGEDAVIIGEKRVQLWELLKNEGVISLDLIRDPEFINILQKAIYTILEKGEIEGVKLNQLCPEFTFAHIRYQLERWSVKGEYQPNKEDIYCEHCAGLDLNKHAQLIGAGLGVVSASVISLAIHLLPEEITKMVDYSLLAGGQLAMAGLFSTVIAPYAGHDKRYERITRLLMGITGNAILSTVITLAMMRGFSISWVIGLGNTVGLSFPAIALISFWKSGFLSRKYRADIMSKMEVGPLEWFLSYLRAELQEHVLADKLQKARMELDPKRRKTMIDEIFHEVEWVLKERGKYDHLPEIVAEAYLRAIDQPFKGKK